MVNELGEGGTTRFPEDWGRIVEENCDSQSYRDGMARHFFQQGAEAYHRFVVGSFRGLGKDYGDVVNFLNNYLEIDDLK